jgi:putative transcriptional regulator
MISCKLQQLLKKRKLTRYRLQQMSGISYPTLHALYRNRSKFYSAEVLDKLCRTLSCQPGDILEWKIMRFPRLKKRKPR